MHFRKKIRANWLLATGSNNNLVRCNDYRDNTNDVAVFSTNEYLQIIANRFLDGLGTEIIISGSAAQPGSIGANQGGLNTSASNSFENPYDAIRANKNSTLEFTY